MQCQRYACTRFPATAVVAALLLAGCTMGAPHSIQSIVPGALVDPVLEPLRGCEALSGEWENQGHQIKEHRVYVAILSAALGMAESLPDTAFADRVRLEMQDDGSLVLRAVEDQSELAALTVPAKAIQCDADSAQLEQPARMQLAVDAEGALWIKRRQGLLSIPYSYRFLPVGHGHADCLKQLPNCGPSVQRMPTPTGMAMVLTGIGATNLQAGIRKVDDRLDMAMVQDGAMARMVEAVYLLPGTHSFDVLVWTPGNYWTARPQTTFRTSASLEACHVYLPVGWHREGLESRATLVDMGKGFDPYCAAFLGAPSTGIRFSDDERSLLVPQRCYANWDTNPSPREFPLPYPPAVPATPGPAP
ncbi:MAG: hypothetical protein KDI87_10740 [Gammaproteobacteria bacterium]|nr:hypothetical protein [Gammaproteobacteria bacterium]